jgi:hypothetical protein
MRFFLEKQSAMDVGVWQAEHIFIASTFCFFDGGSGMVDHLRFPWCVASVQNNPR